MKRIFWFTIFCFASFTQVFAVKKIDRKALVQRHNIYRSVNDEKKPLQVGNGNLAFNVDITGLQTFTPFNTLSHWAFHEMPLPNGINISDFKGKTYNVNGRNVQFDIDNPEQKQLSEWLAANPHPVNLGRIGLYLSHKDGTLAQLSELKNTRQVLNIYTGMITSTFLFDNEIVLVKTACHPSIDKLGFSISSGLIKKGQLKLMLNFPYADDRFGADYAGDYISVSKHSTLLNESKRNLNILRKMDNLSYQVQVISDNELISQQNNTHQIIITPATNEVKFNITFAKQIDVSDKKLTNVFAASAKGWKKYWKSGAAIDFSECTDTRAKELERRVVLSQYLLRVNNAGSFPPPESGLLKNNWYGKFHFEMIWWHGAHFAFWNRWSQFDKMLQVYPKFLPTSKERAKKQGYEGARWPKSTADIDREWPFVIHAFLIWQQPHPIYFAELDYRLHPTKKTLDKWKDVVFETANFMASYPIYDDVKKQYDLKAPLFIMSENTNPDSTQNPTFELSYWRYGLRTALDWQKRIHLPTSKKWKNVLDSLAPLPIENKVYITHEGIKDMWTKHNYEHPGLLAAYGMLPGDGVDTSTMHRTFNKVLNQWDFARTWGWDYPVFAMTAARLGEQEKAIDFLLFEGEHNSYDAFGYNSWVYFPGNGALLSAIAMMAGGWDGCPTVYAPGFPKNGKWNVKVEGFNKMP